MLGFFHIRREPIMPELFWHTDIHSHVCPGIDDGARSIERSVQLVKAMHEMGFRRMIVTPHVTDGSFPNSPADIASAYLSLTERCAQEGIDMWFGCSAEYRIDDLLMHYLETKQVRPLPGNHLLVENSWVQEPFALDAFLFDLRSTYGLIPVLAHPERYPYYHNHKERYEQLHDQGVLFQINILSLAGHYDRGCRNVAEWLLDHNLVDFIGSDLHRLRHLDSIRNYLCSRDYRKLESKADLIKNDLLFGENGLAFQG